MHMCVYILTHVINAIVILFWPSLNFLISMQTIPMRYTKYGVENKWNLLLNKLHHSQELRLSSGRRDHCRAEYSSMDEHGQWPKTLLCRALLLGEQEEWLERPFSKLTFQAGFTLFQKSLEQPSQWSFSCEVINRHVWIGSYRKEQWYVKSPVRQQSWRSQNSRNQG